jgi:hypothetical protein
MGDGRVRRRPALDQPRWRGRLHRDVLAGPALEGGPPRSQSEADGACKALRLLRRFATAFRSVGIAPPARRKAGRLELPGLLQAEKELVDRQALGRWTEAMTLQFLDDFGQALALGTLDHQHGLEQAGIPREWLCRAHVSDQIRLAHPGDCFLQAAA